MNSLAHYMVAAFIVSSAIGVVASIGWVAFIQRRFDRFKMEALRDQSNNVAALQLREIVLAKSRQSVVILHSKGLRPTSYGDGEKLLVAALAGPDASVLACALD